PRLPDQRARRRDRSRHLQARRDPRRAGAADLRTAGGDAARARRQEMTARARGAAALLCATLSAVVNFANPLHKAGAFDVFVNAGQRTLDGRPLYADSTTPNGVIGPPFQGLFFVPSGWIARLSPTAAKATWYVANLIALAGGIWLWAVAL